ncbi:TonB-dependent receptor domain-containing protein [Mucilaginibacter sp. AW1-7]|uniref:TonB-dependent receptor domain-containing protein n=1 Tax=Mucilaginibacter sp. AW1-7 TaxID=3349874 RepID=UPI003F73A1EB
MKLKLQFLLLFLLPFTMVKAANLITDAGTGITGTVIDSVSQKPVDYATVSVFDQASNKVVNGTITATDGKFTIDKLPAGTYRLRINFLGYANKTIANIKVDGGMLKLGRILLSPDSKLLKEVQVTGKKALIEEKIDRTVYNAENDLTARGGDATDVMKRVPMVSVDLDGNVSVRGSANIKVLINGKPSAMASASVSDALKQIPADLIKSVEVITSPSAKYDAEGSGGIINIILRQNTLQGLTLNLNSAAGTRGADLGLNGGYKTGKLTFSLGGFGRTGYNIPGEFNNSQTITSLTSGDALLTTQSANTHNKFLFARYNAGVDYDINEHNSLSLGVVFGANNHPTVQDNFLTNSYLNDVLTGSSLQKNNITNNSTSVDATLTYTLTGKKPEREFSFLTEYSQNNRHNNFESIFLDQSDGSSIGGLKNNNNSVNKELTLEADYQTPLAKNQLLEFGAKDIIRTVTSDYTYLSAADGSLNYQPVSSASLSNAFNYKQNVASGYLSFTFNPFKNYTIKAGTRYEYTSISADFLSGQAVTIPNYGILVPSLNISKKFDNGDMIKLGYNRRIQRPSIEFLNPNIQASNPLNITSGNPGLQPEFTNNFELAYSTNIKSNHFNISAFMRNTNDAIQTIRTSSGDTIKTSYQNLGKQNAYGMSLSANLTLTSKLSLNGGLDMYYLDLDNQDPDPLFRASNHGWVANYRIFGSYDLSDKYSVQAFAFHRSRQIQLQGYQGSFGVYNLSFNRKFANKKGSIGIGADNFLTNGFRIPTVVNSGNINQNAVNIMHNRSIEVTFTYKFGGMSVQKPKKPKKTINNDDLKEGSSNNNN